MEEFYKNLQALKRLFKEASKKRDELNQARKKEERLGSI
jgi:hypothetical protein